MYFCMGKLASVVAALPFRLPIMKFSLEIDNNMGTCCVPKTDY